MTKNSFFGATSGTFLSHLPKANDSQMRSQMPLGICDSERKGHGKWFVMEEIPNSHPLLSVDAKMCCVDAYKYGIAKGTVKQTVVKEEKGTAYLCFIRSEFRATSKAFFDKILGDISWAFGISEKIMETSGKLFKLSDEIRATDLSKLSNDELATLLENWITLRREAHGYGMPWNYVEYEDQLFSKYVTNYIAKRIAAKNLKLSAPEVFSLLSTPREKTFAKMQEEEMLEIALAAKRGKNIDSKLAAHLEKYCWLSYMYVGPAWKKEHFEQQLAELLKQPIEKLEKTLQGSRGYLAKLTAQQEEMMQKLGFDELHRQFITLAQSFIYTKAYRKDAIYYGFWSLEPVFKECAKRLEVSLKQLRMLMSWELPEAVRNGKCDVNELNARYNCCVFHYDGKKKTILSGEAARKFFNSLKFEKIELGNVNEIKGDCACPGKAEGIVRVINLASEMEKMQQGEILVSYATTPEIVPAMKKASAIITDMGGMTCHAAIVSRELNIPCVIGTKVATKLLKDGDRVSVDAASGVVKKL